MPEISVIVPVFRSERTLNTCVDSILRQNCTSSFEILLIDDGSPDACPELCEEYAEKDPRIRVFHQENQGLSAARNRGIRESAGQWLLFVDSDDRIAPDMLHQLKSGADQSGADLVICGIIEEDESRNILLRRTFSPSGIYSPEKSLKLLLMGGGGGDYAVNRLYRKNLFETVRFPVGRYYEDAATSYQIMARAKKVMFLDYCGYYYLRHDHTITASCDLAVHMDLLKGRMEKWEFIAESMPALEPLEKQEIIQTCATLWIKLCQAGFKNHTQEQQLLQSVFRKARKGAAYPCFSNYFTTILLSLSPRLYVWIVKKLRKRDLHGQ